MDKFLFDKFEMICWLQRKFEMKKFSSMQVESSFITAFNEYVFFDCEYFNKVQFIKIFSFNFNKI